MSIQITPVLTDKLQAMLIHGVSQSGTTNPKETMIYIQQVLTSQEYDDGYAFLKWCQVTGTTFGWNLPDVWKKWLNTIPESS